MLKTGSGQVWRTAPETSERIGKMEDTKLEELLEVLRIVQGGIGCLSPDHGALSGSHNQAHRRI